MQTLENFGIEETHKSEYTKKFKGKAEDKTFPEQEPLIEEEPTKDKLLLEIYGQNKIPDDIKQLENHKMIDENGLSLWEWMKKNELKGLGDGGTPTKHCFRYKTFRADKTYLYLIDGGGVLQHKGDDSDSDCYGGCYGSGGTTTDYLTIQRQKNWFGIEIGCVSKEFSKIFMTEKAWAVTKLMEERKIIIPDKVEGDTIQEKGENCIINLNCENEYYRYDIEDGQFRDCDFSFFVTFKYWIEKAFGEDRWKEEFEKTKVKAYKKLKEQNLEDVKRFINYFIEERKDKDRTDRDLRYAKEYYDKYVTYCKFFKETPKSYDKLVRELVEEKVNKLKEQKQIAEKDIEEVELLEVEMI